MYFGGVFFEKGAQDIHNEALKQEEPDARSFGLVHKHHNTRWNLGRMRDVCASGVSAAHFQQKLHNCTVSVLTVIAPWEEYVCIFSQVKEKKKNVFLPVIISKLPSHFSFPLWKIDRENKVLVIVMPRNISKQSPNL